MFKKDELGLRKGKGWTKLSNSKFHVSFLIHILNNNLFVSRMQLRGFDFFDTFGCKSAYRFLRKNDFPIAKKEFHVDKDSVSDKTWSPRRGKVVVYYLISNEEGIPKDIEQVERYLFSYRDGKRYLRKVKML